MALAARIVVMFVYRIDSDEPQHLFIARSWWRGEVAYRDFFDNHMPLFHMLFAAPIGVMGETPGVMLGGRLLMLPLAAASIALVWLLAARLYDRATAFWCAAGVSLMPPLLLKSVEFRNDNLWVPLCLGAILLLLVSRSFLAGLLLGLAFAVSLKTAILIAAIVLTSVGVHFRGSVRSLIPLAAGFLIPVIPVAALFAFHGALDDLVFCAFEFNRMFPASRLRAIIGAVLFIPVVAVMFRGTRHYEDGPRKFVALIGALFIVTLLAFWPLITTRDSLVVIALATMFLVAAFVKRWPRAARWLPVALIGCTTVYGGLWKAQESYYAQLPSEVLRYTRPGETILDLKGENVFRRRPTYFILERVGRAVIESGRVPDTMVRDVIRARCYIAVARDRHFPPATVRFLHRFFIGDGGLLRFAGSRVREDGTFEIAVPGPYTYTGSGEKVWLEAGVHRAPPGAQAVLWSPAAERGFSVSGRRQTVGRD